MPRCFCFSVLIAFLVINSGAYGQQPKTAPKPGPTAKATPVSNAAIIKAEKLKTEEQKRGLELLERAEADAMGLDGSMRPYALLDVARVYAHFDPPKAVKLLEEALTASRGLEKGQQLAGSSLANQILQEMVPLSPQRADELLDQVEPASRETVLVALIGYYQKNKDWDHALQATYRAGQDKEIPYAAAEALIEALPPDRSGDAQQLFATAVSSYAQTQHGDLFSGGPSAFSRLLLSTWKRMPPKLVESAIDEMLNQAQQNDSKGQMGTVTMANAKGAAAFRSAYEYTLFQVLPILKQLDSARADALLRDQEQLRALAQKYPDGLQTNGEQTFSQTSFGRDPGFRPPGVPPPPSMIEAQRMAKIVEDAAQHPQDALANAATLSDRRMRTAAYSRIAQAAQAKKDTTVARSALEKLIDEISQSDPNKSDERELMGQTQQLASAAETYNSLGAPEDARKAIERGFEVAERLYKQDTDRENPNVAPKAYWPSTLAWSRFLHLAAANDPAWALSQLKEIEDGEIRAIAEAGLAAGWLKTPLSHGSMVSSSKKGEGTVSTFSYF